MKTRKVIAILIALSYLSISITGNFPITFGGMLIFVSFSLGLIFFAGSAGKFKGLIGVFRPSRITQESPTGMVEFMGWFFLFFPIIMYFLAQIS